jgi:hypothetical protein
MILAVNADGDWQAMLIQVSLIPHLGYRQFLAE